MSTFRRARIKASVTHLASLAGKRRTGESQINNNNDVSKIKPEIVPNEELDVEIKGESF